ncbi:hypothetical protein V1478_006840 [Vespula squamosa]|uniref:Uncharacterized protein n=1 Tax=Vespula squamosa TaxID=30214 RepID=A0ABD2B1H9_VESSQ
MYHLNHTQIRLKVQWLSTPGDRTKIDDIYADKNKNKFSEQFHIPGNETGKWTLRGNTEDTKKNSRR